MAAQAIVLWRVSSESFFVFDDFYNLRLAQQHGLTFGFLRISIFQHFAPGHRAADWFVYEVGGARFAVAQAILVALAVSATGLLYRVIRLLHVAPLPAVAGAVAFAGAVPLLAAAQWWAAGLHSLPALVLSAVALINFIRYWAEGSRWRVVASAAAVSLASLFYIKALFVPVYAMTLAFTVLEAGAPGRRLRQVVRRWPVWFAYLLVGSVYVVVYVRYYWAPTPYPAAADLAKFVGLAWTHGLAPGVIGLRLREGVSYPTAALLAPAVLLAAAIASLVLSSRRLSPWLFLLVTGMLNVVVTGVARVGAFGTGVAYDGRYYVEPVFLFGLAFGLAVGGVVADPRWVGRAARWARPVIAIFFLARLVATIGTGDAMASEWGGRQSRTFMGSVIRGLDGSPTARLADAEVPEFVVGSWMSPYNRFSEILPVFAPAVRFGDGELPLKIVDVDGSVVDAAVDLLVTLDASCLAEPIEIVVPVTGEPVWLRVTWNDPPPTESLPVFVDEGGGFPPTTDRVVPAGVRVGLAYLGRAGQRIRVGPAPGCADGIDVVRLRPAP